MRQIADGLTLTLLLVRHGETEWNAQDRWQGRRDIPLSDTGRKQVALLRDRLAVAWRDGVFVEHPDALFSSDLSRALDTARIVREALLSPLEIVQTPLLQERSFGSWEGLTAPEVRARFGDMPQPEDGESYEATQARIAEALHLIWHETLTLPGRKVATALVVGHGGSLRFILARALNAGIDTARRFRIKNTGLSSLVFHGSTLETAEGHVNFINDYSHLPTK